jgi:hypothetical protein
MRCRCCRIALSISMIFNAGEGQFFCESTQQVNLL